MKSLTWSKTVIGLTLLTVMFALQGQQVFAAYCPASGGCDYEYIGNVQVGTINNSSDCNGYTDYTAMTTEMAIGTGYAITVTNGEPYGTDKCGIWVDWNQDLDFDDPCETIAVAGNPGGGPYTATITPPVDANLGDTRLRICITDSGYDEPTPCGTITWGEFEDYTIAVVESVPAYCDATGGCDYEYIGNVQVGTINNSSDCNGYTDYTAMTTEMAIGTGYAITVTNGEPYGTDKCGIWVDWNQDLDFDDPCETIAVAGNPGGGPYTATITAPVDTNLGDTRLRICITDSGYDEPAPCGTITWGEFEDYTISVTSQLMKYGGGTGTEQDPYLIYTPEQMNTIGTEPNDWNKHFKLMADIDLAQFTGTQFNIIGTRVPNNPFTGVFDGNGHTIYNFSWVSSNIDEDYIGLFGRLESDANIRNLKLEDVNIIVADASSFVGGLVGHNYSGNIINCSTSGTIKGDSRIGGLVGLNDGTINGCYSSCVVYGISYSYIAGGLVGSNYFGIITNSYSAGNVFGYEHVGGLVGNNLSTISNCYAVGTADGNDSIGGFVGQNTGMISNCYAAGAVDGNDYTGGMVGYDDGGSYAKCFWDSDINPDINGIGNTTAPDYDLSWIGHWKMNDNDDHNQVDDSSGNDNHGTAQQITSLLHTDSNNPPYLNGALTFNGTSDYIDVGDVIGAGAYTKAAWVKRAEGQFVNNIISADTLTHAFFAPKDISFRLAAGHNGSWVLVQDSVPLAVDTWYFVVVTFDPNVESGKMVLYKNGIEVDEANNVPTQLGSTTTYIGRFYNSNDYNFKGEIDNVMIFNKALTAEEIEFLYNEGYGIEILPDGSLDPNVLGKLTTQMQTESTFTNAGWDFISETVNGCEDIWRLCNEGFEYPKLAWEYTLGDFVCPDGVDMRDYTILANQWQLETLSYDVAPPGGDGIVNFLDWAVFADAWKITTDANDLRIFAQQWLSSSAYSADIAPALDGDGWVDELDLAIMVNNWLTGLQ